MTKYLIIFGSPRKAGNTASLLSPFMGELEAAGADIKLMDVYNKNISGCKACLKCQKDISTINCAIKDDMQEVLEAVNDSDVIVLAAPVYVWSAPAPVKAVIDRLVYSSCKYYGENPRGPALLKGKGLAILTTCGYPVETGADLYEEEIRRFCKHCGITYVGMLCERQRNLKDKFMDETKMEHAKAFARELMDKTPNEKRSQ